MLIKDYYNISYIKQMGAQITLVYPAFPLDDFVLALQQQLADQSYSEKMRIIAVALHQYLLDYRQTLDIFTAILGEKLSSMKDMYDVGMPYAPFGKYIELYAVQHPEYFEETIAYLYELTQRYTGEFAMRPLLAAFPEKTLPVLKQWATDENDCVRRLCSECMRISIPWAPKLNFALEHFDEYCEILVKLSTDDCEYVRRSVANNLNELCKADLNKATLLIDQLCAAEGRHTKSLITHGTRWARKHGLL